MAFFGTKLGKLKRENENILFKICQSCTIFSALKNNHIKEIKRKVQAIFPISFSEALFMFFLLLFASNKGRNKIACPNPHRIKVQFAPCQKPLIKNIIKILRICFAAPQRLPPVEYKYSP